MPARPSRHRSAPPLLLLGLAALLALEAPAAARAQAVPREALSRVPARLKLDRSIWQQPAGTRVELEVALRNVFDAPVAAPADVPVIVRSPSLGEPVRVVIRAGQTAARVAFPAHAPGSARIEAVAEKLAPASCVLVTRAPEPAGAAPPGPPSAPSSEPPRRDQAAPPGTGGTGGSERDLAPRILVNPEQVRPDSSRQWTATIRVALFDAASRLAPCCGTSAGGAPRPDMPVQLTAQLGRLATDVVVFRADEYLSPAVALVSTSDGKDRVAASTPLGPAAPAEVAYELPFPAMLRVEASPPRLVNAAGAPPVQILVLLVSADETITSYPDRDVAVTLRTTLGQLDPPSLTIPRGAHGAMAKLTSARDGRAVVSASAQGLMPGEGAVRFSFPLLLAFLAGTGGVAGAFLVRPRQFRSGAHLGRSVATGLIVGVLFFGVASFQAFRSGFELPLPIDLGRIASGNELGAFVIGCLGGVVGRAFWAPRARKKAASAAAP